MSKELEFLRQDYANAKKEVEANNKILEELLENPLVQMYHDTYINNEEKKKELEILKVSLAYKEMIECEHAFVRTEIVQERDYGRTVCEPVYHCLKCGLTNGYAVKEVNPLLLSKTENEMSYIFLKTAKNGVILHERHTCPLDVAKAIYKEIQNRTKNINVSKEQLQTYFIIALSKSDPTYYQDLIYKIRKLAGFNVQKDPKIVQRIELRLRDIPVLENGITCYKISDFTKDLSEFIRIIKQRAGVEITSLEDISKHQELVSEELEQLKDKEKKSRFDAIAVPYSNLTSIEEPKKRTLTKPE